MKKTIYLTIGISINLMQSRAILLVIFIMFSYQGSGQSVPEKISKGGIGFSVIPFGRNRVYAASENEEEGRGVYTFSRAPFYSGNLHGFFNIKKNTRLVIGIGYSSHKIFATEQYYDGPYYYNRTITAFTIPVYLEKTFFKYLFITYGGIVNIEHSYYYDHFTRIDKQSGIGLITSLGGTYHFKSGITVFAGPSMFLYNVISFEQSIFALILGDHIAGIGAEFGMSIDL